MSPAELFSSIYYDASNPYGYGSIYSLYKAAKKKKPSITLKQTKDWFKTQLVPTKFRQASASFKRPQFLASRPNDMLGGDLADMRRYSKYNNGYGWLLVVSDIFSRELVGLEPMKSKHSKNTAIAFDKILKSQTDKSYRLFLTDQGKEFKGDMNKEYSKYNISHRETNDTDQKVSPTEKLIGEIKGKLFKIMKKLKTFRWMDHLEAVKHSLNNRYNRNLRMTPAQASKPENMDKVFRNLHHKQEIANFIKLSKQRRNNKFFKYDIGQIVRILTKHSAFEKSYEGRWSSILYKIGGRRLMSFLPRYDLKDAITGTDIKGSFAENEITPYNPEKRLPENIDYDDVVRDNNNAVLVHQTKPITRWIDYEEFIQ